LRSTALRKGRISNKESEFIEANVSRLTTEEIATQLDRDPNSIEDFIKRKLGVGMSDIEEASYDLRTRPYWKILESQFTEAELDMFDYHWASLISQFKDDVIHSEEMQVVDMVKLDLLMNRSLTSSKSNISQVNAIDALILEERQKDSDQMDKEYLFNLERQGASLRASTESLNRDYRDLQDKKNKMLKDMKATREQRSKHLENKTQSFKGWMTWMRDNPDEIKTFGLAMEKRRLAAVNELTRLSNYHTYEDGVVDQPFLNADTLIIEDDEP
jgi:hypothetical protein